MSRLSGIAARVVAALVMAGAACTASSTAQVDETDLVVNDTAVFPESLTSTRDGRVFIGSTARGIIYRAQPESSTANAWIQPATGALQSVFGVLADEPHDTLWVCSSPPFGSNATGETALKSFNLTTGAFKASYPLPGGRGLCNDIAIASDGTAYVTETIAGRIFRLKPGATALDTWSADPQMASADGIAILSDGSVYVNTYRTGTLLQIAVAPDGSAGAITKLKTSRLLVQPDGMRPVGKNTMLLVEGDGHLNEVTVNGDAADIRVLKSGFVGATAVTLVGDVAYVLEGRLGENTPANRGRTVAPFRARAVRYAPR